MTTPEPGSGGYTLRVAGRLDARWVDWFDGFAVSGEPDGTTTLQGTVTDQAQLHRILAKIRDLGLELLSVEASRWISGAAPFGRA
ncbi:MAG TPA: hypothetical protein VK903_09895 [Propionicimonas sp.]|nr:hypothetical protein [Propionicimonas sp.]